MDGWKCRGFVGLLIVGALSACDDRIQVQPFVAATQQGSELERDALDATVEVFLGDRFDEDDADALLGGDDGLSGVPVDRRHSAALRAGVRARAPLANGWSVIGETGASLGRGAYKLPKGINAFSDPADVTVSSVGVNGSVGLAYGVWREGGISTEISAGLGRDQTRTRTVISSALLDIRETSTQGRTFAFVGVAATYALDRHDPHGRHAFVEAKAKRFTSGRYDAAIALGVRFQQ